MKNLLLIYGGGGTEHEVSFRSKDYFNEKVDTSLFKVFEVLIDKNGEWTLDGKPCFLNLNREIVCSDQKTKIDVAIPCIHGVPNETGQLPALFELMNLPYLGCNQETSVHCFNKMSTKLWLENYGVETTPFLSIATKDDETKAIEFFKKHQDVFVKSTNQGSSVGCYRCRSVEEVEVGISKALKLSPFAVIEKTIVGREFELSTFEFNGEIHLTHPCEIFAPDDVFYTYEEKYSEKSSTNVELKADLPEETITEMKRQAGIAYNVLKIRHLSRMDFFVANTGEVYLNEVNTMPGHTSISMFPSMMEAYGVKYSDFLRQHLVSLSQ